MAAGGRIHPSQWSHPIAVRRERTDGVVVSVIIISQFIKGILRHVIVVSIRDRINSQLALAEEAHQVSSSSSRGEKKAPSLAFSRPCIASYDGRLPLVKKQHSNGRPLVYTPIAVPLLAALTDRQKIKKHRVQTWQHPPRWLHHVVVVVVVVVATT